MRSTTLALIALVVAVEASAQETHVVAPGQTLWSLSLRYDVSGRILAIDFRRDGAGYRARHKVFLEPIEDRGRGNWFGPIDAAVAPDGSLLVSAADDGIYRIYHDPENEGLGEVVRGATTRYARDPAITLTLSPAGRGESRVNVFYTLQDDDVEGNKRGVKS